MGVVPNDKKKVTGFWAPFDYEYITIKIPKDKDDLPKCIKLIEDELSNGSITYGLGTVIKIYKLMIFYDMIRPDFDEGELSWDSVKGALLYSGLY